MSRSGQLTFLLREKQRSWCYHIRLSFFLSLTIKHAFPLFDDGYTSFPFLNNTEQLDAGRGYAVFVRGNVLSAPIWDTRGEIYYKLGEYEKCIKDMNKAISIDKEADNSYYLRGLAKIKIGKSEEGCKDLSKAGELGKTEAYEAMKQNCK